MKHIFLALASIFLLCGASSPDLPEPLKPYVRDNVFDPGDFEWMRGAFPDASDKEKADFLVILNWREECAEEERERVRGDLEKRGFPNVELKFVPITTEYCDQFAIQLRNEMFDSFDEFSKNLTSTRPIHDAMLAATDHATLLAKMPKYDLAADLRNRIIAEQVVRRAFSWAQVTEQEPRIPLLTDQQRPVFSMLNSMEAARLDRANTKWLKKVVAENGWPTKSVVGEDASHKSWLLAQHSDHDPVFQLDVLRLMEPLVEVEEVSKRDYAYLYDRVMLKLVGTQRYATQVTCEKGKRVWQPLENSEQLAALRASIGLEPFEEYLTWFSTPCPVE